VSRHARAVDANQSEVVAMFRALGCSVHSTASVGAGFPDLAVGLGGRTYLVEVKDGRKVPSARRLTPLEAKFAEAWRGGWHLVECREDVVALVHRWRNVGVQDFDASDYERPRT
jgi:hypothetical protein